MIANGHTRFSPGAGVAAGPPRTSRMSRWLILLIGQLACAPLLPAAGPALGTPAAPLNDAAAGAALAAEVRNARPNTEAEFRGWLKIRRKNEPAEQILVLSRITPETNAWRSTYIASRAGSMEILVVLHAPGQTNLYRHGRFEGTNAPAGDPPPCDRIWQPFDGSDFLLADLGLEFLHWPGQVLIQNEMRKNRACHVLESRPAVTTSYARVRSWIDVETGGVLMAEAWDDTGRRVKEFEVRSFKKSGDQWQLQEMEVRDLKTRSRTTLEFDVPEK
jgi:hypothetical protein